jgi:mannosyltransferase
MTIPGYWKSQMQPSTLLVVIIVICAAILRFWGLDYSSLWTDELDSWVLSNQQSLSAVIDGIKQDAHPPMYFALVYYLIRFLGDTEWMLRMPSAIFGIAAVYAIFLLGKQLYTIREGVIAAAVMAVSWAPIYYSQEARSYSLLLFVCIILFHFWARLMRACEANERIPVATVSGYVVAATCTSYLHYFGFQLVVLQMLGFAVMFVFRPPILAKIAVVYGLIFLAYSWWLPIMFAQMAAHTTLWIPASTFPEALGSFVDFAFHVDAWILLVFVMPAYAVAALVGIRRMTANKQIHSWRALVFSSGGLLLLWATLPFMAAFVQSLILKPILVDRYLIISLPAVYLLIARGIAVTPVPLAIVWTFSLCTALFLSLIIDDHFYSKPQKDQYREAVAHVVQLQQSYKDLPIVASTKRKGFYDYYLEHLGSPQNVSLLAWRMDDFEKVQEFLRTDPADGFWHLVGERRPDQEFLDQLAASYTLESEIKFSGTSARLYLVREPGN